MRPISHSHCQNTDLITPASVHTDTLHAARPPFLIQGSANQTGPQQNEDRRQEAGLGPEIHTAGFSEYLTYVQWSSGHQGNSVGVVTTRQAAAEPSNSCSVAATSGCLSSLHEAHWRLSGEVCSLRPNGD